MASATHVVLRPFGGPGGQRLVPGQHVRCEGESWKNARSLESSRYLRPISPADLEEAGGEPDPKGRRRIAAPKEE
jgi:hypothetical protein